MNKVSSFRIYRYHLVPLTTYQVSLFGKNYTAEELKKDKNEYLNLFLHKLQSLRSDTRIYPIKFIAEYKNIFIFKVAVVRETVIYHDFESQNIEHEPFIYVIINNNPSSQKIYIQDNRDVFHDTSVVRNILDVTLNLYLADYFLVIHIEPIIEPVDFWKLLEQYKGNIERLHFNIVKPNLADISKSLREPLKQLVDGTNSHKTTVKLMAPKGGVL